MLLEWIQANNLDGLFGFFMIIGIFACLCNLDPS